MWLETQSKKIIREGDKRTVCKQHSYIYPYYHGFLLKRERLSDYKTIDKIHPFIMYFYLINDYKNNNPNRYEYITDFNIYNELKDGNKEIINYLYSDTNIHKERVFISYNSGEYGENKSINTHRVFKLDEYEIKNNHFIDVISIFLSWYYKVCKCPDKITLTPYSYIIDKMHITNENWIEELGYFWDIFFGVEEISIIKIYQYENYNDMLIDISMKIDPVKILKNESKNLVSIPKIIDYCEINYKEKSLYNCFCKYSLDQKRIDEIINEYELYTKHTHQEEKLYNLCKLFKV